MYGSTDRDAVLSVRESLSVLCRVPGVYELRGLDYPLGDRWPKTISGYFDDLDAMALLVDDLYDGRSKGVYITLNPCHHDMLAKFKANECREAKQGEATTDKHIVSRQWLPIDFDPVRLDGISSTDEEKANALASASECRSWLRADFGFPDPLRADSGNGAHLLYAVDLPNDDPARDLLKAVLEAVSAKYTDAKVKVDTCNFNAGRIWKVPGTMACKGDSTADRPHRRSRLLEVPAEVAVVHPDLLAKVAALAPKVAAKPGKAKPGKLVAVAAAVENAAAFQPVDGVEGVSAWLAKHGVEVARHGPSGKGYKWDLAKCVFDESHSKTGVASVGLKPDGTKWYKCQHDSCDGKGWAALREHFGEPKPKKEKGPPSAAQLAVLAAAACVELFATPDGVAYAAAMTGRRLDSLRVGSAAFRRWLAGLADANGIVPSGRVVGDASASIEAKAFQGPRRETYLRIARVGDTVHVDLADDEGRVVEIRADGWSVSAECPVAFFRHDNMAPLPVPVPGGRLDDLLEHVNVATDDWPLLRGWVLDCFKGRGPYLSALANGEQGTAKSTLCRRIRGVIDPVHKAALRLLQKDANEVMLSAERNAVMCFDNVSSLPPWMSDALASLATGAGMGVRQLYQQDEEKLYGAARPLLFNGIPDFADREDLLDRCVKVTCPPIADDRRQTDDDLERAFAGALPGILGGLFDAVAGGLRHYPDTVLALPRMASSARWIEACERGMGQGGRFLAANEACRADLEAMALANSPLASALLAWLDICVRREWQGRPTELHKTLGDWVPPHTLWQGGFPKNAKQMSEQLSRLAPALRKAGVAFRRKKVDGNIVFEIQDGREARRDGRRPAMLSDFRLDKGEPANLRRVGPALEADAVPQGQSA